MFHVPDKYRVREGRMATTPEDGNNGYFVITSHKPPLRVIASDGMEWEHVSVSLPIRCPTWDEMCLVKALFWDGADVVMQLHPDEAHYVNCHPYCLHLWRPVGQVIPTPHPFLVGGGFS